MIQSGAQRYELFALLLLTLPDELTFHTLFELLRLADRRRTVAARSISTYIPYLLYSVANCIFLLASDSRQALIRFLASIVCFPQKYTRFDDKWNRDFAISIKLKRILHFRAASSCSRLLSQYSFLLLT